MEMKINGERFTGQVAIVTGGADGLGFAVARRLAAEGARVMLFDINAEKLARAGTELGASSRGFTVDVTQPEQVRQAVQAVQDEFGRIDILVNSAGIIGPGGVKSHEVKLEDFQRVLQLNLVGSLIAFQAVAPFMLARNYGRVLNIASISGKEGNPGLLAYATSKAAVIGMTKVQGKDYAETGLTVNALAPAVIRTALLDNVPAEQVGYMLQKIPMKRYGTPEELAAAAAFIVSAENSFSTAFCFDLSGGRATY